jgi:hypothetical protein
MPCAQCISIRAGTCNIYWSFEEADSDLHLRVLEIEDTSKSSFQAFVVSISI